MSTRPFFSILSLCGLLSPGIAAGTPSRPASAPAPASTPTPPAAKRANDEDPDVPAFASPADKRAFLAARDAHIALLRGQPANLPYDPRALALREMWMQESNDMLSLQQASPLFWTSLGPAPIPNGQTNTVSTAVSGRVTAIDVHPANANIAYVGTAQGGLYRTLDGGATWTQLLANAQTLSVGAVAIAPSQPSTVFVGTGEANNSCDSYTGVGIYRIDNADTSPVVTGPLNLNGSGSDVFTRRAISRIVVLPSDANTIFVASFAGFQGLGCSAQAAPLPNRGVYRTTNALATSPTFTQLTVSTVSANRGISDIALDPGNSNQLLAAVMATTTAPGGDGGIYRSTNALAATPSFTQVVPLGTASSVTNVKFAVNRVGSTTTFLAAHDTNSGTLIRSTDGGATWSAAISAATGFCGGQCWYDMVPALKPNDASVIYLGGNSVTNVLRKSTNAGSTFSQVSNGLHADMHALAFAPSDATFNTVYVGNDGGVWKTVDGGTNWTSLNVAGLLATQFESIATHPTDPNFMIGGTQDNGTECLGNCAGNTPGTWIRADWGDGGYTQIDQNATDTTNVSMYHTFYNQTGCLLGYLRVDNPANATEGNWTFYGCNNCTGPNTVNGINCNDAVIFYAPLVLGPGSPNTVYYGTDRLYRSANKGVNNSVVSQAPIVSGQKVSTIAISPQDDNYRLVGLNNGAIWFTNSGSSTLSQITGFPACFAGRAVFDPNDKRVAYIGFTCFGLAAGQHVWKCANLDATPSCAAIGGIIPDVPVNALTVDPGNSRFIYAGTDIGMYRSTDAGATWAPYSAGLPRIAVFDSAFQAKTRKLRIATHGQGIWEIGPFGPGTVPDAGTPLRAAKSGGNLSLSWGASCASQASDYAIYEGTLGSWYSHAGKSCSTSGATTATVTPAAGNTYYLVVARDGQAEGGYGKSSTGVEIPAATTGQCKPQVLSSTCS